MVGLISSYLSPLYMALLHIFKSTFTIKYPYELLQPAERFRGRMKLDVERCIGCGICRYMCPNIAITLVDYEGGKYPQVDYGRCCFCGLCVEYCPRAALEHTYEYELASYVKEELIHSPLRMASPPKPFDRRIVGIKGLKRKRGPTHG